MIRSNIRSAYAAALLSVFTAACAQERDASDAANTPAAPAEATAAAAPADPQSLEAVRAAITAKLPDLNPDKINASEAPGLYEIQHGSLYGYVTADGKYLIEGDLIDLDSGISLTEQKRKATRVARLDALGEDKMIIFAPEKAEDVKYTVTVFTDVDCGYCRKLHREIDSYTDRGIEIRYLFYPRSGPNTDSFRKAEAVWCSDDRKHAMTVAKQGGKFTGDTSCDNPVREEWQLGSELGLRGTPMLILPDGEVVNGYVPAEPLAERLAAMEKAG